MKFKLLLLFLTCNLLSLAQENNDALQNCIIKTINASFEEPGLSDDIGNLSITTDLVPGWTTTSDDKLIEIWKNGFNGVPAYEGNYFIELNAEQVSGIYQDFDTSINKFFTISFAHRGRDGVDVCKVSAGPTEGDGIYTGTGYTEIMTASDDNISWGVHTKTYQVPADQNKTRFIFEALSSSSGVVSVGNFLDAINFTSDISPPQPATINPLTVCAGTSTELNVSGLPNANFTWYDENHNSIANGPKYTTPNLTTNTTYGVTQSLISGCTSAMTLIEVKVKTDDCQIIPDNTTTFTYPKFFTPNGDGYNDTWNITDLKHQADAQISIFDRYGKLVKQIRPSDDGWDGTFGGKLLFSSDYWFILDYKEENTSRQFRSHFSLKR